MVLWVPSQNGAPAVCLHWHSATRFVSAISKICGRKALPPWLPSQNGWLAEPPQVQ